MENRCLRRGPAPGPRLPVALGTAIAVLVACAGGPAPSAGPLVPGDHTVAVEHGGAERSALVHVPPQATDGRPLPVVLSFHGGGGNAEGHREWTGLDALADAEGFVVVTPQGTPGRLGGGRLRTWNAGPCCGRALREGVDDVGFVLALLAELAGRTRLDPTRVYATGLSNGAMMTLRLAADASDRLAAIAPVAGALRVDAPPSPVPVLAFHSVDDPRAPYAGGLGPPFPFTNQRVEHPPLEPTLEVWARAAGCAAEPEVVDRRQGPAREDGRPPHTATLLVWPGCDGPVEVALWRLTGAGHVWPGAGPRYRERWLGPPTAVLDANREIWDFFQRFTRPDAPPLR